MPAKRIELTRFPGAKRIAVTTSFDDGVWHDRVLVKAFNEWGLKGTFNLNSGLLGRAGKPAPEGTWYIDASEVADLYRGHEVAIHTVTHPHLPMLDVTQIGREVLEDRIALEDLVGYPVRGMAYPFGTYDARVIETLRALGVVYCRTVENHAKPFPVDEPLAWPATMHQYATQIHDGQELTMPEVFQRLHSQPNWSGVFFPWGHAYEFERKDDWEGIERLFKPLAGHEDVWYCTNIELFDYEAARQRLVIAANRASAYNPSAIPVTLKVDGEIVEVQGGELVRFTS